MHRRQAAGWSCVRASHKHTTRLACKVRLSDPAQYQSIVDAEWNIIYDKLQKCADSGARVVLSRLAIGDLGTQFFADRDIFCAGRVRSRLADPDTPGATAAAAVHPRGGRLAVFLLPLA